MAQLHDKSGRALDPSSGEKFTVRCVPPRYWPPTPTLPPPPNPLRRTIAPPRPDSITRLFRCLKIRMLKNRHPVLDAFAKTSVVFARLPVQMCAETGLDASEGEVFLPSVAGCSRLINFPNERETQEKFVGHGLLALRAGFSCLQWLASRVDWAISKVSVKMSVKLTRTWLATACCLCGHGVCCPQWLAARVDWAVKKWSWTSCCPPLGVFRIWLKRTPKNGESPNVDP